MRKSKIPTWRSVCSPRMSVRLETSRDIPLQTLMIMIAVGWPNDKSEVPLCIREYWPYRDELATQIGLVYRGTRLVIPTSLQADLTARAYASHLGIQYTINTARHCVMAPHDSRPNRGCPTMPNMSTKPASPNQRTHDDISSTTVSMASRGQ